MIIFSKCDQPGCCGTRAWDGVEDVSIVGCGEPCAFAMGKSGHGVPPLPVDWRAVLLAALERQYNHEYGYGIGDTEAELKELIAAARSMQP